MIVTGIEEQTKTKFKVYLDGTFAFVLYKGELKRFGIKQGEDLAQENYEKIQNEVLLKRAKKRAMHFLLPLLIRIMHNVLLPMAEYPLAFACVVILTFE